MPTISPSQSSPGEEITAAKINNPVNTIANVINGNLDADNLADSAVSAAKLAGDAVTTAKLADANVTNAKLATGAGEPGGAWTSWTPTYGSLTVGNGTATAKYTQIGKTVHFVYKLEMGSTTSISGGFTVSLPVAASDSFGSNVPIGQAIGFEAGVQVYGGWVYEGADTMAVRWNDGTSAIATTFPFTEASGDSLYISGTYEAA